MTPDFEFGDLLNHTAPVRRRNIERDAGLPVLHSRKTSMSATEHQHLQGQNVDTIDQVSSVVLLALAVAGGLGVVVLDLLAIG